MPSASEKSIFKMTSFRDSNKQMSKESEIIVR